MILEENKENKRKKSRQFPIRKTPELINILLKDRTTNKNIIWGTDNYIGMGKDFLPKSQMKEKWIANGDNRLVQPRMKKHVNTQSIRTRENAEVFTPIWIVKKQNDLVEEEFKTLPLDDYVEKVWLEITCGEAPYMCTRYDAVSGNPIDLLKRVGFVDRKLQRISKEIDDYDDWIHYAAKAIKSSYGYELQGDSLLIARENILYTFIDYYKDKFKKIPEMKLMKEIASIISYNLFQMDGLKYTIPLSEEIEIRHKDLQLSLFDDITETEGLEIIKEGIRVKIKNWRKDVNVEFGLIVQGGNSMKFDVVVGNPPYQENNEDRNRDDAIYQYFYDAAEQIGKKYILVSPARFLFGVGSTPVVWNNKMLNDKHLKVAYFNPNSIEVFENTDIKGGVAIIYRDSEKVFGAIETFTAYEELNKILHKVMSENSVINNLFGELMYVQTKFDLKELYNDFPEFENILGSKGKERRLTSSIFGVLPEIFTDVKQSDNDFQIYGREYNERVYKWINGKYLEIDRNFHHYKVFVPAANGSGEFGEVLSHPVIGKPNTGHTQTFISIGNFETEFEAKALLKYLKTKFARAMLGIKKTTQNNKTKETWSKVPVQNFTEFSDINWTKSIVDIDKELYNKYKLSQKEIDFIENNVKEMV